jgi:hypothetical protein
MAAVGGFFGRPECKKDEQTPFYITQADAMALFTAKEQGKMTVLINETNIPL